MIQPSFSAQSFAEYLYLEVLSSKQQLVLKIDSFCKFVNFFDTCLVFWKFFTLFLCFLVWFQVCLAVLTAIVSRTTHSPTKLADKLQFQPRHSPSLHRCSLLLPQTPPLCPTLTTSTRRGGKEDKDDEDGNDGCDTNRDGNPSETATADPTARPTPTTPHPKPPSRKAPHRPAGSSETNPNGQSNHGPNSTPDKQ